jgi:hypothetical protein
MTEQEWLQADDPRPMLRFLKNKVPDRKLRLFAVACCRSVWPCITQPRSRTLINATEAFADGSISRTEWEGARSSHACIYEGGAFAARTAAAPDAFGAAWGIPHDIRDLALRSARWDTCKPTVLLRDIIGPLPFRPVILDPAWLTWHDGLIPSMAQKMYDSRDFSDIPVLADALEEAGCANQDLLSHCRSGDEHVRGCWVVDLLLGKE